MEYVHVLSSHGVENMSKNNRLCNFKNCTGEQLKESCGCWICQKCKRTDGTDCNWL